MTTIAALPAYSFIRAGKRQRLIAQRMLPVALCFSAFAHIICRFLAENLGIYERAVTTT